MAKFELKFNSLQDCKEFIEFQRFKNRPIKKRDERELAVWEALEKVTDDERIFGTLSAFNEFMTSEKEQVVREMTDQLLKSGEEAKQPCLLLGKVQCGKTDTFLSIMSLCFDRGIDIAIVLQKATNTLTDQTIKRLVEDFGFFADNNTYAKKKETKIRVYDVLDLGHRGGFHTNEINDSSRKFVIVAKKEQTNLQYLIEILSRPEVRSKRVLICDDEADFASRAYLSKKKNLTEREYKLYKIAELIEEIIKIPDFCRYLQITATPYSLYLQPDGVVKLREGEDASCWLPRYTGLVPIHDRYVGGKQYYIDSQEGEWDEQGNFIPANIYGYLYENVSNECMNVLKSPHDDFYLDANLDSGKLDPIIHAIVGYMFATAIRYLQQKRKYEQASDEDKENIKEYKSSCLIHIDMEKAKHENQAKFIQTIIERVREILTDETKHSFRLLTFEEKAYNSLTCSNNTGNKTKAIDEYMPSFAEVENEVKKMLRDSDYVVNVVNSDNTIEKDEKGQLKLSKTMNFFIGGSILDRGITIENMLCFFYGRNPGKFQMDTVLQHARMYGARDKEDMACTRFFTTEDIYDVLATINRFDDYIYEYLKAHRDSLQSNEFTNILIGYDKRIAPSAQAKYTPANTKVVKPHQRSYPVGFQTVEPAECQPIMAKIDAIIDEAIMEHKPDENGYFLISYQRTAEILKLIEETFAYSADYENLDRVWNPMEMIKPLEDLTYSTDGLIWMKVVRNREANRYRDQAQWATKGKFQDAPEAGSEVKEDRNQAQDRPVVVLMGQKGGIELNWRGTPFYWPILTLPEDMVAKIFTLDSNKKFRTPKKQIKLDNIDNYPPEEVLKLNVSRDVLFQILAGETTEVGRLIKRTTASMFLDKDMLGNYILVEGTDPDKHYNLGSLNDGVFPYEIRPYKYIHLRASMDMSGSQALVKLDADNPYKLVFEEVPDDDIHYDANNQATEVTDDSKCKWSIVYNLDKVLETKLTKDDEELYEAYINSSSNL